MLRPVDDLAKESYNASYIGLLDLAYISERTVDRLIHK